MTEYLAELRPDVIPPFGIGQRIAPRALLIAADELDPARETLSRTIANEPIAFRLDFPGGLAEAGNEDNWGAGPGGYDVGRLRAIGGTGEGIRIGIADSGLDIGHAAFGDLRDDGRLIGYAGFAADGTKEAQHDPEGRLVPDDAAAPLFTHWHGTFCTAILAGADTGGRRRGIAPAARIAVAKVLQTFNNGTVASIYAGLAWLADQNCDVVSLSLGWEGLHDDWAVPIRALLDRGTVIVAAAGNTFGVPGVPPNSSPANYPLADAGGPAGMLIAVGSIDADGRVADTSGGPPAVWSNFGGSGEAPPPGENRRRADVPLLVAPGVGVVSAAPGGGFRLESGTSMATPHVAGLIAVVLQLLRRARPDTAPIDAARLVLSCASLDGLPANEPRCGRGRIDMDRLAARLQAGI